MANSSNSNSETVEWLRSEEAVPKGHGVVHVLGCWCKPAVKVKGVLKTPARNVVGDAYYNTETEKWQLFPNLNAEAEAPTYWCTLPLGPI